MSRYPADHAGLEVLPYDECLRLLATVPVGRVSFFADGEIVVLPVNHVMDGHDPVFRTARGSKLSAARGQDVVAFEADAYDERTRSGWSVLVNGRAHAIYEGPEIQRLSRLGLHPWVSAERPSVLDQDSADLDQRAADIESIGRSGVRIMRAVVVYESMYGNTHLIADAIGAGLEAAFDVRVVPVSHAGPEVIADADLVVVGGPTHVHGMSRASTRKAAVQAADKPVGGLTVEPDALGPGLREWFGSLGDYRVRAAAFDTRMHGPAALTGRAAKGVTRLLREHGFDVVAEPESFLVTKQDRLEPQEQNRARDWAAKLAAGAR